MERPKILKVHAREHSTFSRGEDGAWVEFPLLGLRTTGATEDEAWEAMRAAIRNLVRSDEAAKEAWDAFVEGHHTVEDLPDKEWEEIQRAAEAGEKASAGFTALTAETFDDFVASETPTLVDFWAEWCRPCHALAPTLAEVAARLGPRLRVAKLNIDQHRTVWERIPSTGIPTMVLYLKGEPRHTIVGAGRTPEELLAELESHLP